MEEPPPFRVLVPGLDVPPPVEIAVMKALVKDRDQRYTSVLEFSRKLTNAAHLALRAEAPLPPLPSAGIVSLHVPESSQPLPSPKVLPPLVPADFDISQLSEAEQKLHKDARRYAKLLVSEIELYNKAKVAEGRKNRDLYKRLKSDIDRSRQTFEKLFGNLVSKQFDYFHDELVKTLGANDLSVLGPEYPSPLRGEAPLPRPSTHLAGQPEPPATPLSPPEKIVPASVAATVAAKPHSARGKWVVIAGCLILLVAAIGTGVRYWPRFGMRPGKEQPGSPTALVSPLFVLDHTLSGHVGTVNSIVFSPDGDLLASGGADKTVKLWDLPSGKPRQSLTGHSDGVDTVAFSPDGRLLASGSDDTTVKLWDVASGTVRQTVGGHDRGATCVTFSPDGKQLASASGDQTINLWDAISGRLIRKTFAEDPVYSIAFSPSGKLLASGAWGQIVKVWDLPSWTKRQTLSVGAQSGGMAVVAFSPDGSLLALEGDDLKLWDVGTGTLSKTLTTNGGGMSSLAFSPDGSLLASGGNELKLWHVESGILMQTLRGHEGGVSCVAFSPDGELLASGGADKTIKLWRHAPVSTLSQLVGWGLPIKLGQTSADVSQALGKPTEIVNGTTMHRKTGEDYSDLFPGSRELRYYNSAGIVGVFKADKLLGITLNPGSDYKGFIPYSGAIVDNFRLTDAKDEILRKLGKESKLEEDPLEDGTDRDKPVVWPAGARYYWRRAGYIVEVDFLRQAQSVRDKPPLTMPKDSVAVVSVYK